MEKGRLVSVIIGVLFVSLLVFLGVYSGYFGSFTGLVVYDSNCSSDQTIMLLSDVNNAHGAIYNQTYGTKICYPNIFGVNYPVLTSPQACNPTNHVLNLSSNTNAHASIGADYQIPICYGDLVCRFSEEDCNSALGEKFVVSLSSQTNAHLSANNNTYSKKICCSSNNANPSIPNSDLVANITSPKTGEIYFVGSDVSFTHISYAGEGKIINKVNWDLGNGTTINSDNFTLSYSQTGTKQITLTVTDNASNVAQDSVEILIAKTGVNVYPIIDSPEDLSRKFSKTVPFNGLSSYAVNITKSGELYSFDCLGGGCPEKISGYCGINCADVNDSNNRKSNYSGLIFNWSFGPLVSGQAGYGQLNGTTTFINPGNNIVNLKLTGFGESDEISNRIFIQSNAQCTSDGNYWDGISKIIDTKLNEGICNKISPNCCPSGSKCIGNALTAYRCSEDGCNNFYLDGIVQRKIELCADYNKVNGDKEDQCKSDCMNAKKENLKAVRENLSGYDITDYSCKWTNNTCTFWTKTVGQTYSSGNVKTTSMSEIWEIISDTGCQNGQQTVQWCKKSATLSSNGAVNSTSASCIETPETTFSCGSGAIELPFFSTFSFIMTMVSILLIYLIFKKRE